MCFTRFGISLDPHLTSSLSETTRHDVFLVKHKGRCRSANLPNEIWSVSELMKHLAHTSALQCKPRPISGQHTRGASGPVALWRHRRLLHASQPLHERLRRRRHVGGEPWRRLQVRDELVARLRGSRLLFGQIDGECCENHRKARRSAALLARLRLVSLCCLQGQDTVIDCIKNKDAPEGKVYVWAGNSENTDKNNKPASPVSFWGTLFSVALAAMNCWMNFRLNCDELIRWFNPRQKSLLT